MSSYQTQRCFSRNTIRHQVLSRQREDFDAQFSNQIIAWTKKPGIQIVQPKPKENKKFLNSKAYETIPLLNGFRRYMSVDVLHESKNNKYEVIFKKEMLKTREKMLFDNAQLRQYSLKFNPQRQDNKIHSMSNRNSRIRLHEHYRISSQIVQLGKKGLQNMNSCKMSQHKRMNSIISTLLYRKQQGLLIQGNKINHEKGIRMTDRACLGVRKEQPLGGSLKGAKCYKSIGPSIKIEDSLL